MKKLFHAMVLVSAFFFIACSSPTSSSDSSSSGGQGQQGQQNPDGTTVTYEKLQLKTGAKINDILESLNSSKDAEAFLPSSTPPQKSASVKYLDLLEKDVPIWYNSSNKTFYFYADDVTTEGATKKLKLNKFSTYMFLLFKNLETLDISHFNFSEVENFTCMFGFCESLKTIDCSKIDTKNV